MQALSTVSPKSMKVGAPKVNDCRRTCNGRYDVCASTATDLERQQICFNSRLHCIKDCLDPQNKKNYLRY